MLGKIAAGWILVFLVYMGTLAASGCAFLLITGMPADVHRDQSGLFIGIFLTVIPYLAAGIYVRNWLPEYKPIRMALWIGVVPVVMEKVLIYALGALLVAGGGDGTMSGTATLQFIRGDMGAPYFTPLYWLGGLLSLAICLLTASSKKTVRSHWLL